jgi:uncharacterized protein (DUF342 family)
MATGPKITYIPAQFRVRVEFSRADTLAAPAPPELLERAKRILRRERAAGRVAFYRIFKTRFERMWAELRAANLPEDTRVAVTLVTGAPPMPGIALTPGDRPGVLARLSVTAAPDVVRGWRFKLFKLTVGRLLRRMGATEVANPAHLHALWLKATREPLSNEPLSAMPALRQADEPYQLLANAAKDEVTLVVFDVRRVLDEAGRLDALLAEMERAAQHFGLKTLAKEVRRELESAGRGPEHFGIDLPFVYLAAIKVHDPGIKLAIAPDRMSATVVAARGPIKPEALVYLGIAREALVAVDEGKPLEGQVVARGRRPTLAAEPFLQIVAADVKAHDAQSMRDAQQRRVARKGQVIAQWGWRIPPVDGFDVTGKAMPADPTPFPALLLGTGVELRADGRFFAIIDGIPRISAESVAVDPALVVDGDVNLASGNLYFTGPATIKGSVEAGAVVVIHGDLTILGGIQGGIVKVSGKLSVAGGIVATTRGSLRVGGDVSASFIENAQVECGGNLSVARGINASQVLVGGGVIIVGPLAGGELVARGPVQAQQIGRGGGKTIVRSGVDGWVERKRAVKDTRRVKLVQHLTQLSALKRELDKRTPAQTTKHQHEQKEQVERGLKRLPVLVAKLEAQLQALPPVAVAGGRVSVAEVLAASTVVEVGGDRCPLNDDVAGVRISQDARGHAKMEALVEDDAKAAS